MPSNLLINIAEESWRGRAIKLIADHQLITPEQALEKLIDAGIRAHYYRPRLRDNNGSGPVQTITDRDTVAESPELLGEALPGSLPLRNGTTRRHPHAPVITDDPESVIGMFADSPTFSATMDAIVARRSQRNGGLP